MTITKRNASVLVMNMAGNIYGNTGWDGATQACNGSSPRGATLVMLNRYYTDDYSAAKRNGVATHEVGHALGLGHMGDSTSVMYPNTPGRSQTSPGSDDIKGVNTLCK